MIKRESVAKADNFTNVELSKVSARAKKIKSDSIKISKVMLITKPKRKERKELEIYLNNKPLLQVHSLKYLGIMFENKLKLKNT